MNCLKFILAIILTLPYLGHAQYILGTTEVNISTDNSENYIAPNWPNNSNGGIGFNPWVFDSQTPNGGFAGHFLGGYPNDTNNINDINSVSFVIFANSADGAVAGASRQFSRPLKETDQIKFKIAVDFRDGAKGFDIRDNSNNNLITFIVENDTYTLNNSPLFGNNYNQNTVFEFIFTQNENDVSWTVERFGGLTGMESGTIQSINAKVLDNIRFFNVSAGSNDDGGGARNLFINNLEIISKYTIPSGTNETLDAGDNTINIPYVTVQNNASLSLGNETLSFKNSAEIINNGTFLDLNGTIIFNGSGTISGNNPRTFNDVELMNGGVDFGGTPETSTINGTLTIKSGGFVLNNSPIYNDDPINGSTLVYNTGGNYGRRSEWSNAGSQGIPNNVVITGSTILDMGFEISSVQIAAEITGDLHIDSGSGLYMDNSISNNMESPLIVGGNFLNNGEIRLSQNTPDPDPMLNGDLRVYGNFTNNNIFTFNNRALFFEGGNPQNLTAQNNFEIPFLVIDKTGGEVVLQQDIIILGTGGPALNMTNEGILNLNNHQLQLGNNTDTPISMAGNSRLIGSTDSKILFNSTNNTANTLVFSQNASNEENYLSEFEMEGSGTVGISNTLNILRRFILNDGTFNSDSHLTFKSSGSLTAVLPEVTGSGTISGDVRVERHFPLSNRAYRYISSSVTSTTSIHTNWQEGATDIDFNPNPGYGTHITGEVGAQGEVSTTTGFDKTGTGFKSLYTYDETNQSNPWVGIDNTNVNTIAAGTPYALMIRGDRTLALINSNTAVGPATTLRTTGSIVTGDQTVNSSISSGEFAFIGNPYQARVDMSQIITPVTNFNTNFMWIWDPTLGTLGGYAVVELSSGNIFDTSVPGTSSANQFLQPFQACLLEATNSNPTLTFVESAKSTSTDNIGTFSENLSSQPNIDIEIYRENSQLLVDAVRYRFGDNFSPSKTFEDATKLWNTQENVAILDDNSYISINKRPLPQTETIIPFYTTGYQDSDYQFKIDLSQIPTGTSIGIIDNYSNTTTALSDGLNTYDFNVDPNIPESMATDRFALIFNEGTLSSTDLIPPADITIYPNPAQDVISIQFDGEARSENLHIECYDVLGRLQFEKTLTSGEEELHLDIRPLSSGYYVLKISTTTGRYNHKFVKK
jgi:hypothetical protein